MDAQQQTQTYAPPDGASILEALNPARELHGLMLTFLGLTSETHRQNGKAVTTLTRNNKPTFTDEFVRNLIKDIQQFVNLTTQVSRFEDKRIKQHVGQYLLALKSSLATQGDDHFISDDTWRQILEIYHAKFQTKNEKGELEAVNGWKRFGISWDYDRPVRYEMLLYGVKDVKEEVDQSFDFKRLIRALAPFLEASLNKSFSGNMDSTGMLLRSLGEMRTETQTFTSDKKKRGGSLFRTNDDERGIY
jgi:hypothetical protein